MKPSEQAEPKRLGILASILLLSIALLLISFLESTPSPVIEPALALEPAKQTEPRLLELPFGGKTVMPDHLYVALYGSPGFPTLGALGEQDLENTLVRARTVAETYRAHSSSEIIPTFEIITTVAAAGPTENDDYSQELDPVSLRPWIDRAKEEGFYVVLDLQSGRTPFDVQAKAYETLLMEPHVGLALDPEWRLQSHADRHLKKVGSVHAEEVNRTGEWLADLVKTHELPQKIFMVHQFKPSMITERQLMKTDRKELSYVIHMDGHGNLGQKNDTWKNILTDLPANTHMGWKNFYDEDHPTPTPEQTMSREPSPMFISYQ